MPILFKIIAAIGLLLISCAVLIKKDLIRNTLFAVGGICLLIYSIHLRDPIFIPLQIIFIVSSLYEIYILRRKKIFRPGRISPPQRLKLINLSTNELYYELPPLHHPR